MILKQFYLNCLAHASYLIGDEASATAAVVDPRRDVDEYVDLARQHGLRIKYVFLTHLHADFLAGHLELRERVGAEIYLGAAAQAEFAFKPLHDGDVVSFGRVRLQALETPGHTAESVSILVFDCDRSEVDPYAVLTGDTLFVGDVGRPDLRVALGWSATDLGGLLYESLRTKLLPLPDASLVYPAHGAGSLCGKALGRETFSTIGEQRRSNYALQPMTKSAFIDLVTADQPDAPAYFTYDAVLNSRERPVLDEALGKEMRALSIDTVLAQAAGGAHVVDTRDSELFCAAHLRGSINIGLNGQYATWAGTLLDHRTPIVIVADPGRERESAIRLGRIGFDNVAGYLEDGMAALSNRPELASSVERVSAARAAELLGTGDGPLALDVRALGERAQKSIARSIHFPLNQLPHRLAELRRDRALLVFCAGGYRSTIAASLLLREGYSEVADMAGGITAWEAAGLPLDVSAPS